MLKKLKGIAALLLLVCLFLPLSQCSRPPLPTTKDQTTTVIQLYAVPQKVDSYWRFLPAVFFVFPLLMVLFNWRVKSEKLRYELIDVIFGLLVLSVILLHAFAAKLLAGGYLALIAAAAYLLASLVESGKTISLRYKNRR